jgi:hypothetical protein
LLPYYYQLRYPARLQYFFTKNDLRLSRAARLQDNNTRQYSKNM